MTDLLQGATSIRFYQRIRTRRLLAMLAAPAFAWTFILATPAQSAASVGAQNALHKRARIGGPRWLTRRQMEMHTGRLHQLAVSEMSGGSFGWEASVGSDNTATGNKLTAIPIVAWTNRGGMAVNFTLSHSSESTHNSETTSLTLDNAGRVTRTDFSNTTYTLYSYDSANRTTEIQTKNSGGTQLSDIQYSYDSASNVSTRTDTDGTVTSFGYDSSDQLTSESRDNSHSTGYSISYTYDHNQNRATKVLGGVTDTYSYSSHDHLTSTSSKSFSYDSNGNCTAVTVGGNTTSLTWDDSNRCSGITYPNSSTNSFSYNGEDLRVQKVDSAGTTNSITDGTSPASPVLKDSRAVYTPGISERASSTSKWYHGDALGSTRGITNGSQTVTDTMLYDGFGMMVTRTGTTATPFGFVGAAEYQSDADSGLQLLGHRMYDPSIGRFISSDLAKSGSNWYAYDNNAPLGVIDPTGTDGRQVARFLLGFAKGVANSILPSPDDHYLIPIIVVDFDRYYRDFWDRAPVPCFPVGKDPDEQAGAGMGEAAGIAAQFLIPIVGEEAPFARMDPGVKFLHFLPNPTGEAPFTRKRPAASGGLSAAQSYDAEGYATRRIDFLSRSGRTDQEYPHYVSVKQRTR